MYNKVPVVCDGSAVHRQTAIKTAPTAFRC